MGAHTGTLSIPREAATSFGINMALSLAFFLAVFGLGGPPLAWGAPDGLAFDFVPQSVAVSLMSALVPALIARKRRALPCSVRGIVMRAIGFAAAGAALGGVLALLTGQAGLPSIDWGVALGLKLAYGGALGAFITGLALHPMAR